MKNLLYCICFLSCTFMNGQEWMTNFDAAKTEAKEKEQRIVLVFSGSDWCAPCMKFEREIWETEVFQSYSRSHYTLLKADFPKRKKNALSQAQQKHNNMLAERYNENGFFPLVVILDNEGAVLGEMGYKKTSPQAIIDLIDAL